MKMRIGLVDVDGHAKKKKWGATVYPNLALAKIAAYHRACGDEVEWYQPIFGGEYDIVYMSKVFTFSPDYEYPIHARSVVRGGTGYDIHSTLPQEIDDSQPDYSIYPNVPTDTAYGFLTRGCPNKCFWCVVPKKEGAVRPYWDIDRVANGKKKVVLMDNNFLAAGEYAKAQLKRIIECGYCIDFNQALDARLMTDEFAELLAQVRWIDTRVRFGCDTQAQIAQCERAIGLIRKYGYKGEFFLYTMIGGKNDFRECAERITYWHERLQQFRKTHEGNAVYAYVQPYRDPNCAKHVIPQWQKDMAQWCNKRMIFTTTRFADFAPRKGFTCREYYTQFNCEDLLQ